MIKKKANSELLNPTSADAFTLTPASILDVQQKPDLILEIIRLQTQMKILFEIAEAPDYGGPKWSIKIHPLVRVRAHLRKIAFDNLS